MQYLTVKGVSQCIKQFVSLPSAQSKLSPVFCTELLKDDPPPKAVVVQKVKHRVANPLKPFYSDEPSLLYWATLRGVDLNKKPKTKPPPKPLLPPFESIFKDDEQYTVPQRPYYIELAKAIIAWIKSNKFPFTFVPFSGPGLSGQMTDTVDRINENTPMFSKRVSDCESENGMRDIINDIMNFLGERGIMTMLRFRETVGSALVLPPGPNQLLDSFRVFHDPASANPLTVGARALSKHCVRSKDTWWGTEKNTTVYQKNVHAEKVLRKILHAAAWMNVHTLPHDIYVLEIREKNGYGARWLATSPYHFRGFLEPQMADGHEKGWKH